MEKKFTPITYILLTLQLVGLVLNIALLFIILFFDTYLWTDLITVSAIILLSLSVVGILLRQKWGVGIVFVKCIFDVLLRVIFFSQGFEGTLIFVALTIILALKEYHHIDSYKPSVLHTITDQPINSI